MMTTLLYLLIKDISSTSFALYLSYLMLVPRDGLALYEREAVGALGEDAVLCDGGQQLPLPRPPQRASLVRDDLGAAVVGHHCNVNRSQNRISVHTVVPHDLDRKGS